MSSLQIGFICPIPTVADWFDLFQLEGGNDLATMGFTRSGYDGCADRVRPG